MVWTSSWWAGLTTRLTRLQPVGPLVFYGPYSAAPMHVYCGRISLFSWNNSYWHMHWPKTFSWRRLSDVWRRLSVAYIGPKSRTERSRKTKVGTEVAHVTRNWDTTFKVKGQGSGSPGRFTQRGLNASGGCSGARENVFAVGNCCYVASDRLGGVRRLGPIPWSCECKVASSSWTYVTERLIQAIIL